MHRGVGHERDGEQGLGGVQPNVAHDQDCGVVVDVEEGEPLEGVTENDQEGVHEFENLGEVEDVGPEKEGPGGTGVWRETDDPVEVRRVGDDGEGATDSHDEGEEEEGEIVEGGDGFEDAGTKGGGEWDKAAGEKEGEGEVREEGEEEEERGGGRG